MQWNLNDHLSTSEQRSFHLPVASDPLGGMELPSVLADDFIVKDLLLNPNKLPFLEIKVDIPSAGLPDQSGLPHPVIRLHAMLRGKMKYKPVFEGLNHCLILTIPPIWPRVIGQVKWFERWLEAGCLPRLIIYENIDTTHLRQMLETMDPDNHTTNQILFPTQALGSDENKMDFINRFLAGNDADSVSVFPGTPIGKFGDDVISSAYKTLRLHIRYAGHTDVNPQAMHPREFFYLLFGNDSREAQSHPLLRKIHHLGQEDAATLPKTKRMLLRPPLRTHARVVWESELELLQETPVESRWDKAASLNSDRFLNSVQGFDLNKTYEGLNKCNLFGFEVLLRSGFRVRMARWTDATATVHVYYYLVNHLVKEAREKVNLNSDKPGILPAYSGEAVWGRRWDAILHAKPRTEQVAEINRMIEEEGRCFYLLREFNGSINPNGSGHFMIVKQVVDGYFPADFEIEMLRNELTIRWEKEGAVDSGTKIGLSYIYVDVYEALGKKGLKNSVKVTFPAWPRLVAEEDKNVATRDNDLLLIEAHPGKDPDSKAGINDLCSMHDGRG